MAGRTVSIPALAPDARLMVACSVSAHAHSLRGDDGLAGSELDPRFTAVGELDSPSLKRRSDLVAGAEAGSALALLNCVESLNAEARSRGKVCLGHFEQASRSKYLLF